MRRVFLIAVALAVLPLAACSLRKPPTSEDFYAQGQFEFAQHEYQGAIENYQKLIDQYPFSPYAEDAEMKIGLAHYEMKDYAEAVGALDDFQRMHPTSKNLDLVEYYIAMSYYDQMGREDQDQTKTEGALKRFQEIEQRFPEGNFAALAREHVSVCREMLARHDYIVSTFYYNRANFKASESRSAEVMQKFPDTPIAPDALFQLGQSLEKLGKKYSAAQAYAALLKHYPDTPYTPKAKAELKKLHQPVDTEEDPLPMVLAESGFGELNQEPDRVVVRDRTAGAQNDLSMASAAHSSYGPDGLPILDPPKTSDPAPALDAKSGPPTLKTIRLSSADPPMSVIFDLTAPVPFTQHLDNGPGYSVASVTLTGVHPDTTLARHLVFDRSIFKDCDVETTPQGTTVTVNTVPVSKFAVVPLDGPPRLLVTFTAEGSAIGPTASSGL